MMQIVKELVEDYIGQRLRLSKAEHLKFLTIIDPRKNKLLEVDISVNSNSSPTIQVTAAFSRQETVFFKFKGGFVVESL
jgi:3-hydroxyacyl-[acyl-carrier-protein] dehydratase